MLYFLKNGYKWYILSLFIADCLLVFFFFNFTFVMKAPSCRVSDMGVYRGLYGRSWFFFYLCRKDRGGGRQHSHPSKYFEKLLQYAPETILADWTFVFYLKVTFEEYQPSWKSRGPHGKLFWDYFSLANCELVFHVSFSNHYYWKLRYRWHWVIGFHFILFFSHPFLFLSVPPLPPHLLLCPSHSLQTPPPSSPLPSVHPSSPRSSVDCRGRHWTVNLTPGIMTRGRKLIMIN